MAIDRAFDDIRPPSPDLIDDCVHCGFCLETCPTYALWNEEMDSPRGRIVLMRAGLEEGSEMSAELVTHIDQCLGCMACVTACPSGVQYDKLIEDTRAQVERNTDRGRRPPLPALLFEVFTHPGGCARLAPLLAGARRLGLDRLAANSRALAPLPAAARARRAHPAHAARARRCAGCRRPSRPTARRGPGRPAPGLRAAGVLRRRQPGDRAGARRGGLRGDRAARAALLRRAAAPLGL